MKIFNNNFYWTALVFGLIGLDQLSKFIFVKYFEDLVFYNKGIAFSVSVPIHLVILLAVIICLIIGYLKYKNLLGHDYIWAVFIAGAAGNLIDRVRIQAVIDFINLGWFPVFNIADIFLTVSAILIAYFYILKSDQNG
jgi:signal peptidase II